MKNKFIIAGLVLILVWLGFNSVIITKPYTDYFIESSTFHIPHRVRFSNGGLLFKNPMDKYYVWERFNKNKTNTNTLVFKDGVKVEFSVEYTLILENKINKTIMIEMYRNPQKLNEAIEITIMNIMRRQFYNMMSDSINGDLGLLYDNIYSDSFIKSLDLTITMFNFKVIHPDKKLKQSLDVNI